MDLKRQKKSIHFMLCCAYFAALLRLVPIHHAIGEYGAGIFAAGYLLFFLYDIFVRELFSEVISRMISARKKWEQHRNAERVFQFSFLISLMLGLLATFLVWLLAPFLAGTVLGIPEAEQVIRYLSPAYAFCTVSAAFSAYMRGMGEQINDSILRLGSEFLVTLMCFIISAPMYRYGNNVSNLLKQSGFGGIHGARGCALGVSVGSFICMLIYLFLHAQMKVVMQRQDQWNRESSEESDIICIRSLFISSAVHYLNYILIAAFALAEERVLRERIVRVSASLQAPAMIWGVYAATALPLMLIPYVIYTMGERGSWLVYKRSLGRDEKKYVRDMIQAKIRRYAMGGIPLCVCLFALSSPLISLFYGKTPEHLAKAAAYGVISIAFFGFCFMMMQILIGMEKPLYITVIHAFAFAIHSVLLRAFTRAEGKLFTGVGAALLFTALLMTVAYAFIVSMRLNYRHRIADILKPVVCSAVAGAVAVLIRVVAGKAMGNVITVIVGIFFFLLFYVILMIVLRGFTRKEISRIPCGEFIMKMLY